MIYLVGMLCLFLMRLQDINFVFDYLVPVYSVLVVLLVVGVIPSFTATSPGDRKLYVLKKKQKQPSTTTATDNRHWKDCYDGESLLPFFSLSLIFLFTRSISCAVLQGEWMMCERNADEMAATDKWLTWAGQGYVQRTVALRLKGKQTLKLKDQSTYHYKREFIGPTGKPVNPFEYAKPNNIGTSRDTAEPQTQPFQGKDVYFRVWWDEENKVLFEEQGPLGGADDKSSDIPTHILYRRRIERGSTPADDRFVTEWEGTKVKSGEKCTLTTIHQRVIPDS